MHRGTSDLSAVLTIDRDAATPLHRQVADALRRHIAAPEYAPGAALPSETELATALGVSRQTVRQALGQLASEGLLERVVGRGTFVATPHRARTGVVVCIVTRLRDELIANIVDGAERAGRAAGLRLEVANALGDPDLERRSAESALTSADGVLMFATGGPAAADTVRALKRAALPYVLVDRAIAGVAADLVTADNVAGGELAAQHLLALGHRRVVIVRRADDTVSTVLEREAGFRAALRAAGLPDEASPVIFAPSRIITAWDYLQLPSRADHPDVLALAAALERLRPTAAFAINDVIGVQTVLAAHRLGWQAPGDLSVIGFGDDSHARTCVPPLTTIHQDAFELGRQAMELLVARLADPARPPTTIRLPVYLVAYGSTGEMPSTGR